MAMFPCNMGSSGGTLDNLIGKVVIADRASAIITITNIAKNTTYQGSGYGSFIVPDGDYTVHKTAGGAGFNVIHSDNTSTYAFADTLVHKGEIVLLNDNVTIQLL